ncbi:MAG: riboflavin biosynthesis protein RibD, partial [Chloroflexi bacterium CG15_BIG_FIL_POST_REV_8_21_14_020_46_15]
DGKIATRSNQSKWISNREAREYVHSVRHIVDAIMVGVNTVLIDDPRLTARGCSGKGGNTKSQPLRIIVDSKGRTPLDANVFKQPGETLIATVKPMDIEKKEKFIQAGVEVLELPAKEGKVDVGELSRAIGKREILSVLVEGGSALLGSFFDSHLVDKVMVFISPIVIGGDGAKAAVGGNGVESIIEAQHLSRVDVKSFGDNILVSGYVER